MLIKSKRLGLLFQFFDKDVTVLKEPTLLCDDI